LKKPSDKYIGREKQKMIVPILFSVFPKKMVQSQILCDG